jgi:large subunit ribosomal protein L18
MNYIKLKRIKRVRSKIIGSDTRPRLAVFKSNMHISAQLIDDKSGKTIIAVNDKNIKEKNKAEEVGKMIAIEAKKKKIKSVVFDRRQYKYHGKIKELAEAAKKEGLVI